MSYFLFGLKEVAKECPRNRDALLGMGVMTQTKMDNRCRGNVEKNVGFDYRPLCLLSVE